MDFKEKLKNWDKDISDYNPWNDKGEQLIVEFAQELKKLGWEIISTGGTKVALDNAGVDTTAIDDVTGFPEMMDGRVKELLDEPVYEIGRIVKKENESVIIKCKK